MQLVVYSGPFRGKRYQDYFFLYLQFMWCVNIVQISITIKVSKSTDQTTKMGNLAQAFAAGELLKAQAIIHHSSPSR